MRLSIVLAVAATILSGAAAQACEAAPACLPDVVVFPAYTPEGLRIGTVAATVRHGSPLERSRFTGRPMPVLFNNPGSVPGAVDPWTVRMPLPHVRSDRTQAVYPRGY